MKPYDTGWLEELKRKHPYPGGWRANSLPTDTENAVVKSMGRREPIKIGPEGPVSEYDFMQDTFGHPSPKEITPARVFRGRVCGTRAWIIDNLTFGWTLTAASVWLRTHRNIRRERVNMKLIYYDASDVLTALVAAKALRKARVRPSVSSMLHGSDSINDKLLAFVENGAE